MSTQTKKNQAIPAHDLSREETAILYEAAVKEANLVVWEYEAAARGGTALHAHCFNHGL
jgi:hypothetical protein